MAAASGTWGRAPPPRVDIGAALLLLLLLPTAPCSMWVNEGSGSATLLVLPELFRCSRPPWGEAADASPAPSGRNGHDMPKGPCFCCTAPLGLDPSGEEPFPALVLPLPGKGESVPTCPGRLNRLAPCGTPPLPTPSVALSLGGCRRMTGWLNLSSVTRPSDGFSDMSTPWGSLLTGSSSLLAVRPRLLRTPLSSSGWPSLYDFSSTDRPDALQQQRQQGKGRLSRAVRKSNPPMAGGLKVASNSVFGAMGGGRGSRARKRALAWRWPRRRTLPRHPTGCRCLSHEKGRPWRHSAPPAPGSRPPPAPRNGGSQQEVSSGGRLARRLLALLPPCPARMVLVSSSGTKIPSSVSTEYADWALELSLDWKGRCCRCTAL